MKRTKRLLHDTAEELVEGKVLLAKKREAATKATDKLSKNNAKRSAALIDDTVEAISDHQDLLVEQLVEEKTGKTKPPPRRGRQRRRRKSRAAEADEAAK